MQWHLRDPARWEAEQKLGQQFLDGITSGVDSDGIAFMQGVFHVRSQHDDCYESVTIRIEYPPTFPKRRTTPTAFLISHRDRWVKKADAHINSDWSLCLFVPGESGIDFVQEDSLNGFFAILHTFLSKEHLYQRDLKRQELTGEKALWPGEARSHGLAGIIEAVRDKGDIRRNDGCPCGSGLKFKACCLRLIPR